MTCLACNGTKVITVFVRGEAGRPMPCSECQRRSKRTGVVRWYDDMKGYGVIDAANGSGVIVRYAAILGEGFKTLKKGDAVEFESGETQGVAVNVRKV